MLLFIAWLLWVIHSICLFHELHWINLPWTAMFSFASKTTAVIVWLVLVWKYYQSINMIKRMSQALDVDPKLASFVKVKRKWSRMMLQLCMIAFLLLAYVGIDMLQFFQVKMDSPGWIRLGVWMVWLHSLIWFTLSWQRDQRLRNHLEREVVFALEEK
ncbi:MAG: hypothetical protein KDD46_03825 [Bdellovibrionales bacterium]|nr:hypothetical protein [Bdellovibrionales bacterium]